MSFKETLHKIVHHDEYDHIPSVEELKEVPVIGGEMEEAIQYEPRTAKLQQASDSLEEFLEEDLE